ncbi:CD209 antigen-like protein C isoform X2 [Scomber scombrus]|uniref:CD209 antigen-like protein C isoform X2 n=1 Tax=Scomber scombrus TaxID=13677 RepID=UPI002DD9114D|nr:CD209 antigen-like protein C isoform X2 [Scomber scombrus]
MEDIYTNVEKKKPVDTTLSTNQTGPRSSERRFHGAVVLCLGLLSVFLLAGLIGLGVYYSDVIRGLTEERDLLNANLTETTEELHQLRNLSKQNQTCPAGWKLFSCSCYLLSSESGSWSTGRQDCREKGADLGVIDSLEKQEFFSTFNEEATWIGLTDRDTEGTWKWIDGTPLTLSYWGTDQPDNGGGDPQWGEEDCVHIRAGTQTVENWNDLSCGASLQWICEKNADV